MGRWGTPDELIEGLQRLVREVFGPAAVASGVLKHNFTDFDVRVEAAGARHVAQVQLDLRTRRWKMRPEKS